MCCVNVEHNIHLQPTLLAYGGPLDSRSGKRSEQHSMFCFFSETVGVEENHYHAWKRRKNLAMKEKNLVGRSSVW